MVLANNIIKSARTKQFGKRSRLLQALGNSVVKERRGSRTLRSDLQAKILHLAFSDLLWSTGHEVGA